MRRLACLLALLAMATVLASVGCASPAEPPRLAISLRDDAVSADVEALQELIVADASVQRCEYWTQSDSPSEEQAAAASTGSVPGDWPWVQSQLLVTLVEGAGDREADALANAIEAHATFERTVLMDRNGTWWRPQD